jgi:capsular polysaccharide biosynthesis protein
MSLESERRPAVRPVPELEEEQEVDFGRYWAAVAARWWLLVLGAVVGLLVGLAVSTGGNRPYLARTTVYLGQPFAPGAVTPIQNLSTQIGFVAEFVRTRSALTEVADKAGVPRDRLRSRVSTEPIENFTNRRVDPLTPLIEITVRGFSPRKNVDAANDFAQAIVREFSEYVDQKLDTYQRRERRATRELANVNQRIRFAQEQQARILGDSSIPATEKLIVLANFNNVLQFNEQRRANLEGSLLSLRDVIALAQRVEQARVIDPAFSEREAGPSRRTAAVVGALIGILVGLLAALLWEPVARLVRGRRSA